MSLVVLISLSLLMAAAIGVYAARERSTHDPDAKRDRCIQVAKTMPPTSLGDHAIVNCV